MDWLVTRSGGVITLFVLVATAVLVVAVPVVVWRTRRVGVQSAAWTTTLEGLICGSSLLIGALTLRTFGNAGRGEVELVPLRALLEGLSLGDFYVGLALYDLLANVALFVPLGLAIGLRFAGLRLAVFAPAMLGLTVTIEALQGLVLGRSADITDVLTNTSGGIVGVLFARALQRIWPTSVRLVD